MPLGDIAAGVFEVLGKFVGQIFIEIILELLIKGPGYLILKILKRSHAGEVDPDSGIVIITGITFWILLGGLVFMVCKLL